MPLDDILALYSGLRVFIDGAAILEKAIVSSFLGLRTCATSVNEPLSGIWATLTKAPTA